jgi:hypothetical protein
MGHDRDGKVRRPFANVFHLQPDRGLEFFAGFRWLLQVPIAIWPCSVCWFYLVYLGRHRLAR